MESTSGKVCPVCGQASSGDAQFCVKCGARIAAAPSGGNAAPAPQNAGRNNKLGIGIGVGVAAAVVAFAIVGVVVLLFMVNVMQASNLKKELMRDWTRVEGEDGAYILCILDFTEDEIEYRLETGYSWMDTTVANYDYKVVNKNTIKVLRYGNKWETITVEFNKDKTMMTVRPALTSVDSVEYWFNLD